MLFARLRRSFLTPTSSLVGLHLASMCLSHDGRQIASRNRGGLFAVEDTHFELEILRQQFAQKHRSSHYLQRLHAASEIGRKVRSARYHATGIISRHPLGMRRPRASPPL